MDGITAPVQWVSQQRPSRLGCCWRGLPASCWRTLSDFSAFPLQTGCDFMTLLVVGSIALDSIFTPFGETADALGGSAVYFSVAGSILHPVQVVGIVGKDYPYAGLGRLGPRGVGLVGGGKTPGGGF